MKIKHIFAAGIVLVFLAVVAAVFVFFVTAARLPQLIALKDYKPLVVSEVYSRDGEKIGEFFREKRIIVPYEKIPKKIVYAFISAEDSKFFEHSGINYLAVLRAALANLKAGHSAQGGSTITQQVAKSLMLTPEKKLSRKIKEAILAYRMEKNLKKEDILYLYLNQIYLGHGAYGVEAAAHNYFRKSVNDLTLGECAILAGLPQAPTKYSPITNPTRAKERQIYVLNRMAEEGYIKKEDAKAAIAEPVKVYFKEEFEDVAPAYKEAIRQFLNEDIGEDKVLDEGVKIYTSMDLKKQVAAEEAIAKNLRDLDKRQGYRGVEKNLKTAEEIAQFLVKERDDLMLKSQPYRIVYPDAKEPPRPPLELNHKPGTPNLPAYLKTDQIIEAVVTKVNSKYGLVTTRFGESQGLLDLDDMNWARKPDATKHWTEDQVRDPAKVLQVGDVIQIKIKADNFASKRLDSKYGKKKTVKKDPKKDAKDDAMPADMPVFTDYAGVALEQDPNVQGALLSFDLQTQDVLAMVGGANFAKKTEFNRALQAARQTGSAFKAIIYAAAMEKGFNPASVIQDAPIIYEEGEGQETKKWKPGNFENKFSGDVLFRTAIIKSLNIPTVKILEKVSLDWVAKYARRLGIFSPLNLDYTMALGSSGITLYEMTKAFSAFGRGGKRIHPILIKKVTDSSGKEVLAQNITLDEKFKTELDKLEVEFHPEMAAKLGISPSEITTPTPAAKVAAAIAKANENNPSPGDGAPVPGPVAGATPGAVVFDPAKVFNFSDPDQLISPQTSYLITHLLKGVVLEGTGFRARAINRPAAGKTGTTNGYNDAWFVGFTPHVSTGVWVGYDEERSLGRLETGNASALPIWVDYMTAAVESYPAQDFTVPSGIVFANIDSETGKLATAKTKKVVREAFREGTEPTDSASEVPAAEEKNFFKEDLSD